MPFADNPAAELRARSSGLAKSLILAIVALWCLYWFVHAWHYWEDDAWIHLEFARSVAAGHGFAFNGHVVAGDTAPLWVFLLAGMHALIPDWIVAGKVLTVLGAAVGFAGVYAFARRLGAALLPGSGELFPTAMVLLIAVNPFTCYWIYSGMESLAAAGLACFAILAATSETPSIRTFLTGCALAGIAPLVRPEMTFLTALLALPLLAQWFHLPKSLAKAAAFAAGAILICAPLALWSLYSLHAFGHLLPNTNAAKRAGPGDSVPSHLVSIYSFGFPVIVVGLIAAALYAVLRAPSVRRSLQSAIANTFRAAQPAEPRSLPLAGWIFIFWASINTVFYIANHTYVQTRYILVTAPGLMVVILATALAASWQLGRAAYVLGLVYAAATSLLITRPFIRNKGIDCQVSRDLALFMRNQIPPDAPVAVFSIGEIAFVSEHPIIDTGGITRPGAIPYMNGPAAAMVRWAESEGAQYFIGVRPEPDATRVFSEDMKFVGWSFHLNDYNETDQVELWKVAPSTGSTEAGLPPAQPGHP